MRPIGTVHEQAKMVLDFNAVLAAAEESMFGMTDTGFCIACGEEHVHVEPDARFLLCDSCGMESVFGAPELLLYMGGGLSDG